MIEGFDVSHWNGTNEARRIAAINPEMKFVVIKATQGTGYVDPCCKNNAIGAVEQGLVYGLYHFPNGTDPVIEAEHFIEQVHVCIQATGKYPFLVLDWEGKALDKGAKWARTFCENIILNTGCKPLIYCSANQVKFLKEVQALDCGLWIARWNKIIDNPGDVSPWSTWAMWQYTSTPFDKDRFNGTVEQLQKYCMKADEFDKCHCGCEHCCESE